MLCIQRDANKMSFQRACNTGWLQRVSYHVPNCWKKELLHTFGVLPIYLNVLDHDKWLDNNSYSPCHHPSSQEAYFFKSWWWTSVVTYLSSENLLPLLENEILLQENCSGHKRANFHPGVCGCIFFLFSENYIHLSHVRIWTKGYLLC